MGGGWGEGWGVGEGEGGGRVDGACDVAAARAWGLNPLNPHAPPLLCRDPGRDSQLLLSVDQSLPMAKGWLRFTRVRLRADEVRRRRALGRGCIRGWTGCDDGAWAGAELCLRACG